MLPSESVLPSEPALAPKETVLPILPVLELAVVVHERSMVTISVPVEGPVCQVMSPIHSSCSSGTPSQQSHAAAAHARSVSVWWS